ncbi:MAG: DUF1549 domain-containing protein, partial [Planctomycetaceae bacterium]|nr:DUF1549 domain-containing protein [Planctomycetaceae bacterium]
MASQIRGPTQFPIIRTYSGHTHQYNRSAKYYKGRRKPGLDPALVLITFSLLCLVVWAGWTGIQYVNRTPSATPTSQSPNVATAPVQTEEPEDWDSDTAFSSNTSWDTDFGNSENANPFDSDLTPKVESRVDEIVMTRLTELNIKPASLCSDAVFLRRVYIDCLGTLPTWEEAQQFLDSKEPDKRAKLIEEVLRRPEFADYAAMKWSDILRVKAEFPIKLW